MYIQELSVYRGAEMFKSNQTSPVEVDRQARTSISTNEQTMERTQAVILWNCSVTISEIVEDWALMLLVLGANL